MNVDILGQTWNKRQYSCCSWQPDRTSNYALSLGTNQFWTDCKNSLYTGGYVFSCYCITCMPLYCAVGSFCCIHTMWVYFFMDHKCNDYQCLILPCMINVHFVALWHKLLQISCPSNSGIFFRVKFYMCTFITSFLFKWW